MTHTDIRTDVWYSSFLPAQFHSYARLMRLDRPIGTWLLLWPCLWGLVLSHSLDLQFLSFAALFIAGSVLMRGAGCIINDLYDQNLDAQVERTSTRPLPSGEISRKNAFLFLALVLFLSFLVLLQFNSFTIILGLLSLPLVAFYPLAKRVTWWPQFVLGLTFNWGALMGFAASEATLSLSAFILYGAGLFWTLGYDTIYAHQDKRDDLLVGIKSLALYLGEKSKLFITLFYVVFYALLNIVAFLEGLSVYSHIFLLFVLCHALWQVTTWDINNPANSLTRFKSNRELGLLVFIAFLAGSFS
ncbi:MAG: 4-hydroxybenzoate octaprenyltransferase [Proteobacteria bacterium]|nr:4-hydroxybenzoate octaprenyltransferase [Pseudomonadota bacterium]